MFKGQRISYRWSCLLYTSNDAGELVLKKKLELSLELMPKEVREELEQGILFGSLDEVEQWLEDIAS